MYKINFNIRLAYYCAFFNKMEILTSNKDYNDTAICYFSNQNYFNLAKIRNWGVVFYILKFNDEKQIYLTGDELKAMWEYLDNQTLVI